MTDFPSVSRFPASTAGSAKPANGFGAGGRGDGDNEGRSARPANCCFTADTLILMADGRSWRISDLRPGDLVLGGQGRANRVIAAERMPLNGRRLYAINHHEHFFTAESPFLTRRGWKSLDPASGRQGPIALAVRSLNEGDILLTARSGPAVFGASALRCALQLEDMPLVSIHSRQAPEQPVFSLLVDGDRTFVANGVIVYGAGGAAQSNGSLARPDREPGHGDEGQLFTRGQCRARNNGADRWGRGECRGESDRSGRSGDLAPARVMGTPEPAEAGRLAGRGAASHPGLGPVA